MDPDLETEPLELVEGTEVTEIVLDADSDGRTGLEVIEAAEDLEDDKEAVEVDDKEAAPVREGTEDAEATEDFEATLDADTVDDKEIELVVDKDVD